MAEVDDQHSQGLLFTGGAQTANLLLEVLNTCGVTWMVSELLLMRRRSLPEAKWLLPLIILLNVLASPWTHAFLGALGFLGQSAGSGLGQLPHWALCLLRTLFLCSGFSWVMYIDLGRMRSSYSMKVFLHELWNALWLLLPVYPVLVIIASFVFLVLESILECIGLPHALGQAALLYGQFYAPLGVVYFMLKRDWLGQNRKSSELPLPSSTSVQATRPFAGAGSRGSRLLRTFGGSATAGSVGG